MSYLIRLILITLLFGINAATAQDDANLRGNQGLSQLSINNFRITQDKAIISIRLPEQTTGQSSISVNGEDVALRFSNGIAQLPSDALMMNGLNFIKSENSQKLMHLRQDENTQVVSMKSIPLWLSIVPPLLAIIIALVFKEVIIALFIGIWSGAVIAGGFGLGNIGGVISSFFRVLTEYIVGALANADHLSVILFSLLIGGMVALISKNGGMQGVVNSLSKYARSPRSAQFITWLMGIAIFFDDYANTLIVGNTMRSVTDKFKISREKLAYIVDSTAAPVSAIAFITTWIGAELGYIDDGIAKIGIEMNVTPYAVFLSSLKYSFYPILTIIFIVIIIYQKKDFGPMYQAEMRARTTGKVSSASSDNPDEPDMEDLTPVKGAKMKASHAIIPVASVILVTILGLLITGFDSLRTDLYGLGGNTNYESWGSIWSDLALLTKGELGFFGKLGSIIGASNSYVALMWSSLIGVIMALVISTATKTMKLLDATHWMITGFKTMIPALMILTMAWALAITTDQLHTADYISAALEGNLSPVLLPAVIFILAAFIAFSTGSSWSTMAILYPIAIPTAYAVCAAAGMGDAISYEILLAVISTVLAASVLGDHISPISDTTILSSLASDCNHLDHIKTQFPYAMLVGIFSITGITISIMLGGGFIICLIIFILCILALFFIVKMIGKVVPDGEADPV